MSEPQVAKYGVSVEDYRRLEESLAEAQRTIAEERDLAEKWIARATEFSDENAALHSRIAELEKRLVRFQNEKPSEQHDVQEAVLAKLGIREKVRELQDRIAELESQVAAYHAAAARVAGDALRARNDALEEAAALADKMQDAAGLILARGHDGDAATQHDVAKEIAEAIRALSGPEEGTSK